MAPPVITLVSSFRSSHQREFLGALEKGFKRHGIKAIRSDKPQSKIIATWGWRSGKQYRAYGHEVLVVERGYIGDRMKYTSLGWNGLNGYAEFPKYPYDGGQRFIQHGGRLQEWKTNQSGDYILMLGQVKNDASLQGQDMIKWYKETADSLKILYNKPVLFRAHPESIRRGGYANIPNLHNIEGDLQSAIAGAAFTVSYNSNSSLDSIMAGVPSISGEGCMAYDLCMNRSEYLFPSRERRFSEIAHCQWSVEEIENGKALEGLLCKFGL